jgi:hypothetical protein
MEADAKQTAAPGSAPSQSGEPRSFHPEPGSKFGDRLPPEDDAREEETERATSPNEALHAAKVHFAELREYLSYYMAAKSDGIKSSFRNLGLLIGLGVVGLMLGGAIVVTAGVLLLTGLAGGIGALFGGRLWLGQLIVGLLLVGAVGGGAIWFYSRATRAARERTMKKYESRKRQQRDQFRTDVAERAAE